MSTALSLTDPNFWDKATVGNLFHDGPLFFVPFDIKSVEMDTIISRRFLPFSNTAILEYREHAFDVVINGGTVGPTSPFKGLKHIPGFLLRLFDSSQLDEPIFYHEGIIIKDGKRHRLGKNYAPPRPNNVFCPDVFQRRFFVAYTMSSNVFKFGEGKPPADAIAAMGGLCPVIIRRKKFGMENEYPTGLNGNKYCSAVGIDPWLLPQQFSFFFRTLNDSGLGKTIVAMNPDLGRLLVLVQQDAPANSSGFTLSSIRDNLHDRGVSDSVAFDGGNSAFFQYRGKIVERCAVDKEYANAFGLGFRHVT